MQRMHDKGETEHLPAKQNFANQHIVQRSGGMPECWNQYGNPDEGIGGSQDASKCCEEQRET